MIHEVGCVDGTNFLQVLWILPESLFLYDKICFYESSEQRVIQTNDPILSNCWQKAVFPKIWSFFVVYVKDIYNVICTSVEYKNNESLSCTPNDPASFQTDWKKLKTSIFSHPKIFQNEYIKFKCRSLLSFPWYCPRTAELVCCKAE